MKVLLSRWQFGVTITYHFLFVPLTIGLALLVAVMQVLAYVKKDGTWERLSRFFGVLFLINFAMGVVTGIVQEFQFGMNWSNYSVFVGNIFGAPLAMEGLLAFFAESTFIGLWLVQCRSGEPNDHELLGRVYRQARCATSCLDPDEWFPLTADVGRAREQAARAIAVCAGCPVRADCLELSLRHSFGFGAHGVWGGLVAEERRALRRRLAGVFSR